MTTRQPKIYSAYLATLNPTSSRPAHHNHGRSVEALANGSDSNWRPDRVVIALRIPERIFFDRLIGTGIR